MIVYMDRASIESLTVKDIREIVVKQSYQMKYQKLERYYVGDHDILHSERTDKTGGDNRLHIRYPALQEKTCCQNFRYGWIECRLC